MGNHQREFWCSPEVSLSKMIYHYHYQFFNPIFQISSWRQRPSTRKKNHHPNLPHLVLLHHGHTQDEEKWGNVFHLWSLFSSCAFLPLLGSCEGKTQKRQATGENKNKWRQISPHSPSTQITSVLLHTPTPPTLHLPLGPCDGVVVRYDPNVPLF